MTDIDRIKNNIESIAKSKKYFILGVSFDKEDEGKISVTGFAQDVTFEEMLEGFKKFIEHDIAMIKEESK